MGSRPAYDIFRSAPREALVLKRYRIGWPAYGVFGRFMMFLAGPAGLLHQDQTIPIANCFWIVIHGFLFD
jgi:hypothetical protein